MLTYHNSRTAGLILKTKGYGDAFSLFVQDSYNVLTRKNQQY